MFNCLTKINQINRSSIKKGEFVQNWYFIMKVSQVKTAFVKSTTNKTGMFVKKREISLLPRKNN